MVLQKFTSKTMSKKPSNKPKSIEDKFNEKYGDLSEPEIQKEILFTLKMTNAKLEKIRANTSNLVWFLIVIPIIIGVIMVLLNAG